MASNLPPGVTPNMVFGEPEGFTTVTEQLVLIGDERMVTLQVSESGDFTSDEFCIDLDPTEAKKFAKAILAMVNGNLTTTDELGIDTVAQLLDGLKAERENYDDRNGGLDSWDEIEDLF